MIIYLSLLIPVLAVIVLWTCYNQKMQWWEYLLVFLIPVGLIFTGKATSIMIQKSDTEYWNNYITTASYTEPWDEWIHRTCYQTCYEQCTDSDGHSYRCRPHDCFPYDCSYRKLHDPGWSALDNSGKRLGISKDLYSRIKSTWGKDTLIELNRRYYRLDGDEYRTFFDDSLEHIIPRTTKHTYENRVKCSKADFDFVKVDSGDVKKYGLFNYPEYSEYNYNPILGCVNPLASRFLQQYNGLLGMTKQVHMLVLVFKDQPEKAGKLQEGLWKRGNKNEFILCIGVENNLVTWCRVISWTEEKELKKRVESTVRAVNYHTHEGCGFRRGPTPGSSPDIDSPVLFGGLHSQSPQRHALIGQISVVC